jgi:hypothetical protein
MKITLTAEQEELLLSSSNIHVTEKDAFKKNLLTEEWEIIHMSKINHVVTEILTK